MTLTAVILIIISTFLHAGWNLLGKQSRPTALFFSTATLIGALMLLPLLVLYHSALAFFSPVVWGLLFCTGLAQAIYYLGLAEAYNSGIMSVAYPMVRSIPVVLVAFISILLGNGEHFSGIMLGGIGLIVIGAFGLPMAKFKDFSVSNYVNRSNLFALVAALGSVGYSLIDDHALRVLRSTADGAMPSWQIAVVYAFFEAVFSGLWLGIAIFIPGISGESFRVEFSRNLSKKALTGVGIYLTYTLVLISMAFVRDVSYVVAFRQLSLPIGVMLGIFVLKEPASLPKFFGIVVMVMGLILVSLG